MRQDAGVACGVAAAVVDGAVPSFVAADRHSEDEAAYHRGVVVDVADIAADDDTAGKDFEGNPDDAVAAAHWVDRSRVDCGGPYQEHVRQWVWHPPSIVVPEPPWDSCSWVPPVLRAAFHTPALSR